MTQAAQIVVNEIESLERRVRAFSEFSSEPTVRLTSVDINVLVEERVSFLKSGHSEIEYRIDVDRLLTRAICDADRVKGILTNLLENGAEAAGAQGKILASTFMSGAQVIVEIHDSGPGLSAEAMKTLFEPTITFKARGMGLGPFHRTKGCVSVWRRSHACGWKAGRSGVPLTIAEGMRRRDS
jgi:nitrogen fixation/metabolism regulation signal transduction histidine kinase